MKDAVLVNRLVDAILATRPGVTGFVRVTCPFCPYVYGKPDRRRSLRHNPDTGAYRCYRCGTYGRLDTEDSPSRSTQPLPEIQIEPPDGFVLMTEELERTSIGGFQAGQYLRSRGFFPRAWESLGIGACLHGAYYGRVIVPVKDGDSWLGWVGRVWTKKAPLPYIYPPGMRRGEFLFNQAALAEKTVLPVLVVEGVFDAMHLWPHGVAVMGKPTPKQKDLLLASPRPVVWVLDGDAWEEAWSLTAEFRLLGKETGFVKLPPRKDPDEYPAAWILECAVDSLAVPV